jgi:hypothetical protein
MQDQYPSMLTLNLNQLILYYAKHYFEDFSHWFQPIVANKENKNKYLEVGNYDPLG